jgi:sugar O-acyltransferase (sialic acid O-acetyltransferase NeuD family)
MRKNIILGAGGHAKEVLEVLIQSNSDEKFSFFNNTVASNYRLFKKFEVYCKNDDLKHFDTFYLGIGNIRARKILSSLALQEGLRWKGVRSKKIQIGSFDIDVHETVDIMDNVSISSSVKVNRGTLLNRSVNIHHDVAIGEYCEIAPNAQILGSAQIGNNVFIGAGAIILPKVIVGANAIIGAGAVVTKDVVENITVVGVPAESIYSD